MTLSYSMKAVRFHKKVEKELAELDVFTRSKIVELLTLIAKGEFLGMPMSRPMPVIAHGAHELRIQASRSQFRIFYFVKMKDAVLVFHFLKKKTQATPKTDIETAQRRLGEMI